MKNLSRVSTSRRFWKVNQVVQENMRLKKLIVAPVSLTFSDNRRATSIDITEKRLLEGFYGVKKRNVERQCRK